MANELIVAPPAAGKTYTCIQRIQEYRKKDPLSRIWVVLPDRQQVAAFRSRLAISGGAMGTTVGTFSDLYHSILEHNGIFVPIASSPLLHRLIQETLDKAVEAGQIHYFAPLQRMPGFIQTLRELFSELKRGMVNPEHFIQVAGADSPAHQEMALVYSMYQARLKELNMADSEGISWLAAASLERQPQAVSSIDLLIVDGFDSFNGTQFNSIFTLSRHVRDMLVTFPGSAGSSRTAHRRFAESLEKLMRGLDPQLTLLKDAPRLTEDMAWIESRLFEVESVNARKPAATLMLEARSPAEEVREALRWIKKQVIRNSVNLSECAVFIPSQQVYQPLIRMIAAEYGIPVRFTRNDPITNSPAVTALMNLVRLPLQNFSTFYLFNALRSPYFDFGMDVQIIDELEKVGRVTQVVDGRNQWQESWNLLCKTRTDDRDEVDEEMALVGLPHGGDALKLKAALDPVFDQLEPPEKELSLTEWITWLEQTLEDLHFYERADSDRDRADCEVFSELLKAAVVSETIAGDRRVGYADFMFDLQAMLEGVGQREVEQSGGGSLLVCQMVEARGVRYKSVVLMGFSEGSFPINEHPDPFLDEELRAKLGLESRLQREQAGLFYQAVTRSDRFLLVTRPYLSDDGEKWEESAYWKALKVLFDDNVIEKVRPEALRPLPDAASSQELLFTAVRAKELPAKFRQFEERWNNLRHADVVINARRAKKAAGPYEGETGRAISSQGNLFPSGHVWSSSRLENYSTCPLNFYVNNVLKLEPKQLPEPGLNASQLGSIIHKILELTYTNAANPGSMAAIKSSFESACSLVFSKAPVSFGFRPSPLWEYQKQQVKEKLLLTIEALESNDNWTPVAMETKFGIDGKPPLSIELDGECILVRGVIDRIDQNLEGEYRVIDYKTGSAHMAPADLRNGRRLQLPIYALAVRDALGLGGPVEGFYWKVMSADASSLKLSNFKVDQLQGVQVAFSILKFHLHRIVGGIRAGNFSPATPRGGCPSYCPCSAWCWRYDPEW